MKLLEFFNEAQEVELRSPGTLQKVLDSFLSQLADRDDLDPQLQDAEKRTAIIRSRLDQSKDAGMGKYGPTSGQYGKLVLEPEDMNAIALALKMAGEPGDAMKLKDDLKGMNIQEISGNGFEGNYGGDAEGFEVQNQGVTRRRPGEGPSANGGRVQPQEMDSYDQPQFALPPGRRAPEPPARPVRRLPPAAGRRIRHEAYGDRRASFSVEEPPSPSVKPVFEPGRTSGISGYDFTRDNDEIGRQVALANAKRSAKEAKEVSPGFWTYRPGEEEPPPTHVTDIPVQQDLPLRPPKEEPKKPFVSDLARQLYPDLFKNWEPKEYNEEFMGVRDPQGFDKQDPHQGSQEAGPIAAHESALREMFCLDEGRKYTAVASQAT